jgi:hypothetical protein
VRDQENEQHEFEGLRANAQRRRSVKVKLSSPGQPRAPSTDLQWHRP